MAVFNGMFPVLPGKEEAARSWIAELEGGRKEGFDAMQRRSEIARETLTLMETPGGSFLLFWFEGSDVEKAFATVIGGEDDFTRWHRERLLDVTGVDLTQAGDAAPPETLLDWAAS
jgi:Family of unknown function (DUF6176)